MTPEVALLAATALHAGFQSVVTVVVYPALVATPAGRWRAVHAAHSRRITYVVAPVYLAVAAACGWLLVAGPRTAATWVAVGGNALAGLTTALVAAPTHGALGRQRPTPALLHRLVRADLVRFVSTVVALVAAVLAVS